MQPLQTAESGACKHDADMEPIKKAARRKVGPQRQKYQRFFSQRRILVVAGLKITQKKLKPKSVLARACATACDAEFSMDNLTWAMTSEDIASPCCFGILFFTLSVLSNTKIKIEAANLELTY